MGHNSLIVLFNTTQYFTQNDYNSTYNVSEKDIVLVGIDSIT